MKWIVLALALSVLNSCTTVGTNDLDDFGKYINLRPGVTTKVDVYDSFGQPADVVYAGTPPASPSDWIYLKADMQVSGWSYVPWVGLLAGGVSEENMIAKMRFDDAGYFRSLQTDKDTSYTNQWMGLTRDIYRASNDPKEPRVASEMARIGRPFNREFARKVAERRLN